jgi:hypothetical protein
MSGRQGQGANADLTLSDVVGKAIQWGVAFLGGQSNRRDTEMLA